MAKFIVIDGLDGCGKATQVAELKKKLEERGYSVYTLDFPNYNSESSAAVKMYLNGEIGDNPSKLNPYMCASFYAVDRFINFEQKYKKIFEDNDNTIIFSDRYLSANIIYHGEKIKDEIKRRNFIKWCYEYECGLCGLPIEDITIVLTLPPEVSQKLLEKRYAGDVSKKDIHEKDVNYLSECYDRIRNIIDYVNTISINDKRINWAHLDCCDYSKMEPKSIGSITDELLNIIMNIVK